MPASDTDWAGESGRPACVRLNRSWKRYSTRWSFSEMARCRSATESARCDEGAKNRAARTLVVRLDLERRAHPGNGYGECGAGWLNGKQRHLGAQEGGEGVDFVWRGHGAAENARQRGGPGDVAAQKMLEVRHRLIGAHL